jgi:opacity protein-like surface antigen
MPSDRRARGAAILTPHWTVNVEYLYVDLDGGQVFDIVPGIPEPVRFTANVLRAGVKYQF